MADALALTKDVNKSHRTRKSGAKANKKANKKGKVERHNPKAFSVANVGRTKRSIQRNLDIAQRKEYVPQVDKSDEAIAPPPVMVVVMGPKGSGKSTLIRSLVKYYTNRNLAKVTGPITVVSGKKRRLTFFECPSGDACAMTDLAKIADLVLLMVDASFGFEMETFEFLNVLQIHGFPKVMGVLTHLDKFSNAKSLRKTRKKLKARFWTEIYQGAKMFYLSGVLGGDQIRNDDDTYTPKLSGKYPKGEVRNMCLHISRVKFRPLVWRNTHPFVLIDRYEDITSPHELQVDRACDRDITAYGYVRGSHLKPGMKVHVIGAGDYNISDITLLPDPCPLPQVIEDSGTKKAMKKRTSLSSKDTLIFAPMADIGNVRIDQDAVYIEVGPKPLYTQKHMLENYSSDLSKWENYDKNPENSTEIYGDSTENRTDGEAVELLRDLQNVGENIDEKMKKSELQLFSGGERVKGFDVNSSSDSDSGSESDNGSISESEEDMEDALTDNEESEGGDNSNVDSDSSSLPSNGQKDNSQIWKTDIAAKAAVRFLDRQEANINLMEFVYKNNNSENESNHSHSDSDNEFFKIKSKVSKSSNENGFESFESRDSSKSVYVEAEDRTGSKVWTDNRIESIRNKFVTGNWGKKEMATNNSEAHNEEAEEIYGDFEDLLTGAKYGPNGEVLSDSDSSTSSNNNTSTKIPRSQTTTNKYLSTEEKIAIEREENARKKAEAMQSREKNDENVEEKSGKDNAGSDTESVTEFLEEAKKAREAQLSINRGEFEGVGNATRAALEGYRQGSYVRIKLQGLPSEFVENFRSDRPVIIGGLQAHEVSLGLVRCRVKRHRWFNRILKSNDPLVFSIGWRRFQSIPVYAMEDESAHRHRFLKYTPEHMHCECVFFGPICPPGTGLLAFQSLKEGGTGFRVSLTGTILELDANFSVVKKLKLIGHPDKIFKKTAFVNGMFNSDLEVAKFEGAAIKTVSGIRGQIKKAVGTGSKSSGGNSEGGRGRFRATFEDKILMSDTVICRLWTPIEPKKFYNPVTTLLDGSTWQGMRTTAMVRRDEKMPVPLNKDSLYKPIERGVRRFNKLSIPKTLQESLPYATKPKNLKAKSKNDYMKKRAVIRSTEEKKKSSLMHALNVIRKQKDAIRKTSSNKRKEESIKKQAKLKEAFAEVKQADRKRKFREMGQNQAKASKAAKMKIAASNS